MAQQDAENIKYLFEPRSIAILGASRDRSKIGYAVFNNIRSGGYRGSIYPVNPAGGDIEGVPVFRSILEIGEEIDVACITIPAKFVPDAVRQCTQRGVKHCVVITSGFSEIGNFEEEKKMVSDARAGGMRILGPNVFGIYSSQVCLNATFVSGDIPSGHLAMITQSGALGLTLVGQASVENIGLSAIVSVGNKSDIDESDLLSYLCDQETTRIILMYIEGVRNGEKFIRAVSAGATFTGSPFPSCGATKSSSSPEASDQQAIDLPVGGPDGVALPRAARPGQVPGVAVLDRHREDVAARGEDGPLAAGGEGEVGDPVVDLRPARPRQLPVVGEVDRHLAALPALRVEEVEKAAVLEGDRVASGSAATSRRIR